MNSQTAFEQTIFVFPAFGKALPDFLLHPRTFLDKAISLVAVNGLKVTNHADFNQQHLVEGSDPRIPALFTPEIAAGCAGQPGLILEAQQGRLIGYWNKRQIKPEEYVEAAKFMLAIGKAMRSKLSGAPAAPAAKGSPTAGTKPAAPATTKPPTPGAAPKPKRGV